VRSADGADRAKDSQELHFSCLACTESVRLPLAAVTRVAVAT
jgi:hypothetical protein